MASSHSSPTSAAAHGVSERVPGQWGHGEDALPHGVPAYSMGREYQQGRISLVPSPFQHQSSLHRIPGGNSSCRPSNHQLKKVQINANKASFLSRALVRVFAASGWDRDINTSTAQGNLLHHLRWCKPLCRLLF